MNHLGQLPAVTISFNTKPGVSLSDAVSHVQAVQRELRTPATLSTTFQGTAQAFQASLKGQGLLAFALGTLPAPFSSLVIFLEAVAAALFAWIVLHEALEPMQWMGGVLILAGIFVARPRNAAAGSVP